MELELDNKKKRIDHLANIVLLNSYSRQGGVSKEWDRYRNLPKYEERKFKPWSDQDQTLEVQSFNDYTHLGGTTLWLLKMDLLD